MYHRQIRSNYGKNKDWMQWGGVNRQIPINSGRNILLQGHILMDLENNVRCLGVLDIDVKERWMGSPKKRSQNQGPKPKP